MTVRIVAVRASERQRVSGQAACVAGERNEGA